MRRQYEDVRGNALGASVGAFVVDRRDLSAGGDLDEVCDGLFDELCPGLLRFARICGVSASAQGLVRHTGLAKQLFGMVTPDTVLRPLAETAELGDVAPHIFSFGGLAAAARWAAGAAAGHITLHSEGFSVDPP